MYDSLTLETLVRDRVQRRLAEAERARVVPRSARSWRPRARLAAALRSLAARLEAPPVTVRGQYS